MHAPAVSTNVLILLPPRPERGPDSRPAGGPAGSRRPRPGHASGPARARRRRRPSPARAAAREEAPAPGRRRTPRRWCRPEPSSPGSSRPATTRRSAWSPAPGCAAPFPGRGCRGARGLSGGSSRCAYRTRRRRPAGLGRSAARRCATGRARSRRARWHPRSLLERPARPPPTSRGSQSLSGVVGRQAVDRPRHRRGPHHHAVPGGEGRGCSASVAAAASPPCSQARNRRFFDVTPIGA